MNSNNPKIIYFIRKNDEIVYIGQTSQALTKRKQGHITTALNGRGSAIGAAIRKHGPEAFTWDKHCVYYNQVDLDAAEKHFIAKYTPRYNVSPGGQNGIEWSWNKGKKETRPEVLQNISNSAKNRRKSKRPLDTQEAKDKRAEGRRNAYKKTNRPFICNENNKIYVLVVDAAKDLNISANGIYAVLNPNHSMKSYMRCTFNYIQP